MTLEFKTAGSSKKIVARILLCFPDILEILSHLKISVFLVILANDQASKGVWVHASTDTDLTWINPKWRCGWGDSNFGPNFGSNGGDVMTLRFANNKKVNGAWCDTPSTGSRNFICKAPISEK